MAIEHAKLDNRGSKQQKAAYEKEKMRLMYGEREKIPFSTRIRKAFLFTKKDFNELIELDREYEDEDEEDDDEGYEDEDIDEEDEDDDIEDEEITEGVDEDKDDGGKAGPSKDHIGPVVKKDVEAKSGVLHCRSCGSIVRDHDKFCMDCGTPMEAPVAEKKILAHEKEEAPALPPGLGEDS